MNTARSTFTDAIEDHLALKQQNAHLEGEMPIDNYDVGDPLDRYPGGPVKPAVGQGSQDPSEAVFAEVSDLEPEAVDADWHAHEAPTMVGNAAMVQPPMESLGGMAPLLSLVTDLDDEDTLTPDAGDSLFTPGGVVRFPGGAGGDRVADETQVFGHMPAADTLVGDVIEPSAAQDSVSDEQPVIVIDSSEPLTGSDVQISGLSAPAMSTLTPPPAKAKSGNSNGGRWFGLGRKKNKGRKADSDGEKGAGWFAEQPRDFEWK